MFIDLDAANYTVLPQSYRIPTSVHTVANRIIGRVSKRLDKDYKPRDEAGSVRYISNLGQVDLSKGTWLLLARNITFLSLYAQLCKEQGVAFIGDAVAGLDPGIMPAVTSWKQLQEGNRIGKSEAVNLYRFMSQRDRVARGKKILLSEARLADVSMKDLTANHGLLFDGPWDKALDMLSPEDTVFLKALERKGDLTTAPRVKISTIHGAKGQEADGVVLMTDMTHRTFAAYQQSPDVEHRVFYVGVTRARRELHILNPQDEKHYTI